MYLLYVMIDEFLLNNVFAECSPTSCWSHESVGLFIKEQKVGQTTMDHFQKPEQAKVLFA